MNNFLRHSWLVLLLVISSTGTLWADEEFNPSNPPEPMVQYVVSISADPAEGVSSITKGGEFSMGRTITISATVQSGYRFLYWTLNGREYTTSSSFTYTVGDSSVVFVAHVAKNPMVTVNVTPAEAGRGYGSGTYSPGNRPRIYTNANSGYTFLYWTLNGEQYTTSSSFYYTIGETDLEFVAVYQSDNQPEPEDPDAPFEPESPAEPMVFYPVTITTNLPAGVKPASISRGGSYAPGKEIQISTTASTDYAFLYWALNGRQHTTSSSFAYTVGDSAVTLVAVFEAKQQITTSVTPAGAGAVTSGGWYRQGTELTINTSANSGYTFKHWTLNGEEYAATPTFRYSVGSTSAEFVAVYEKIEEPEPIVEPDEDEPFIPSNPGEPLVEKTALLITVLSADTTMGIVSGLPTTPIFEGDTLTLTATPKPGYAFRRWSDGNTANPRTITPTRDGIYKAYFEGISHTITFFDCDSTVLDSRQWAYGETPTCISPAKPEDDNYSYRFKGWQPQVVPVTADACYYARYDTTVITKYPVFFLDWDGSVLSQQNVIEGGAATAPANPVREGYTFTGWGSDFSNITAFTIVLAQYEEIVIEVYSVRFYDWDNTLLKTDSVLYGRDARAPSKPTREGYTFIGWDTDFHNVTMSLIVNALYRINRYCVRFLDWNGTVLQSDSIDYLGAATAPANPTREGFTFIGWDKTFDSIRTHMDITALYEANRYPVYFVDWDGTVLSAQEAGHGGKATPPANPAREGYTFMGWQGDYSHVYGTTIVVADYTAGTQMHTVVSCQDGWDNSEISTSLLTLYLPLAPAHAGYAVSGYDVLSSPLAEGIVIRANYLSASNHKPAAQYSAQAVSYTVYFLDWNNTILATQSVPAGGKATPPTPPTRPGYIFTGWSADLSCITANTFAIAQYTKAQAGVYAVRFVDWDGTILKTDSVSHGGSTTAPVNPSREGYTFIGWDKDFHVIKEEMTITAQYRINPRVCFIDWDGTILAERIIDYGATATAPANPSRKGYTFSGWQGTYTSVTNEINFVVAQYAPQPHTDGYPVHYMDGLTESMYAVGYINFTLPTKPAHTGFLFSHWLVVEGFLEDGITLRAVFEKQSSTPTAIENYSSIHGEESKLILLNGQIFIVRGGRIYTLTGQAVL